MDLTESSLLAAEAANLKSLELLFDYTIFHIGVYLTLASSFITIASIKTHEKFSLDLRRELVWLAVLSFSVAGMAGGVIVSNLTQCYGMPVPVASAPNRSAQASGAASASAATSPPIYRKAVSAGKCTSTEQFLDTQLGPYNMSAWFPRGRVWTWIEHTAFWLGLVAAICAFLFPPKPKSGKSAA